MKNHYQLTIIGGGPAGMAAACGAAASGLSDILVLDRNPYMGGILPQCVHDGFGLHLYETSYTGPEYAQLWREKMEKYDIDVLAGTSALSMTYESPFRITYTGEAHGSGTVTTASVILAMGCREKSIGAMRIPGSRPAGILTAGAAQYMINRQNFLPGKSVVILGSGDIGLIMARRLSLEGAQVKLILGEKASGLARNHVQCVQDFGIPIRFGHTLLSTHGFKRLKGVTIAKVTEGGKPDLKTKEYIPCDTLLLAAGLIPETELWKGSKLPLTMEKGIAADERGATDIPGVFACGNVTQIYDVVDMVSLTAEETGAAAAAFVLGEHAKKYVSAKKSWPQELKYEAIENLADDEIVCILCPKGCRLKADARRKTITGYSCEKGLAYGLEELTAPKRMITSTVKLTGSAAPLLPVRSEDRIPKELLAKAMAEIRKVELFSPVALGEVILPNLAGSGIRLLASASEGKK